MIFLLLVVLFMTNNAGAKIHDDQPYSSLSVKVEMKKNTFEIREPIEGEVIIKNIYPAVIPAVFHIRLFHDGKMVAERITSVQNLRMGTTKFSFHNFGVPDFNHDAGAEGDWHIKIIQQNLDESYAASVNVRIIAASGKTKKVKKPAEQY